METVQKLREVVHIYWQSSQESPEKRMGEAIDACAREVASIVLRDDEDTIGVIGLHRRNAGMILQRVKELCPETIFTVANPEKLETEKVKVAFLTPSNLRGMGMFDYLLITIASIETDAKMITNVVLPSLNTEESFVEVFDLTRKQ